MKQFDCTVLDGRRSKQEQDEAVERGASKTRWPDSKHNCPMPGDPSREDPQGLSRAMDLAPYPINWNDTKRFYYFAGFVMAQAAILGIKLRWGGDWDRDTEVLDQTFFDLPHFELVE